MQMRVSLAAMRSSCVITRPIDSLTQTIWCFPTRCRSSRFSASRRRSLSAFSTVSRSLSLVIGFSRKSSAPSFVARTAISMCACPDIITTGVVMPFARRSSSSAKPSRPGITTSERMRSKGRSRASSSACIALLHTATSCPARRKARDSEPRVLASSSTTMMSALRHALAALAASRRQFHYEGRTAARRAFDANSAIVIAYHRLHNGESQAGAMLLGGVVRREEALAFFGGHSRAGVGDAKLDRLVVTPGRDASMCRR